MYMINNLIDDVVTKKLKTVLAMGGTAAPSTRTLGRTATS